MTSPYAPTTPALDLSALEAVAKAATQKRWHTNPDEQFWTNAVRVGWSDEGQFTEVCQFIMDEADAEHIATFDPPTVLAMVAELRSERARADAAEAKLRDVRRAALQEAAALIEENTILDCNAGEKQLRKRPDGEVSNLAGVPRQFRSGDRVRWYHPPLCCGTVLKQAGPQVKVQWDTGEVRRDDPEKLVLLTAAAAKESGNG